MPSPRQVPDDIADALVAQYAAGGRVAEIGKPFGYDYKTTRRVLVGRGAEIKVAGGRKKPFTWATLQEVVAMLEAGKSCRQIAIEIGTYPQYVASFLRDHGIEPPDARTRRGSANPITKSGRTVGSEGYVSVILDEHEYHLNSGRRGRSRNYMLEHRLVMARHLGRALYPHENVHHKNGDRADNRLENLELWTLAQTPGQRADEAPPRKHCPTCTCC